MRILKIFPSQTALQVFAEEERFDKYNMIQQRGSQDGNDVFLRSLTSIEDCHKLAGVNFDRVDGYENLRAPERDYIRSLERTAHGNS